MIVYVARHIASGCCYVGQSVNTLKVRRRQHEKRCETGMLSQAIHEFGKDAFEWDELWSGDNAVICNQTEKCWIRELNSIYPNGFNLQSGGRIGPSHCEETRKKMSALKIGHISWSRGLTKATDTRIAYRTSILKGMPKTVEHRKAMSLSRIGRPAPQVGRRQRLMAGKQKTGSKHFIVTDPQGTKFDLWGLKRFCLDRGLNRAALSAVAQGLRNHHHGYKCRLAD